MHVASIFYLFSCLSLSLFNSTNAAVIFHDCSEDDQIDIEVPVVELSDHDQFDYEVVMNMFLDNLNKKFTGKPACEMIGYKHQDDNFSLAGIHDDLLKNIFEYLDKKDVDIAKTVSTKFRSIAAFDYKLKRLNPYAVFPENWLNEAFYTFLKENNMAESITADKLEIVHQKIITDEIFISGTVLSIYFNQLAASFLNELIYGLNESSPTDYKSWRCNLVKKSLKYPLPTSYQSYQNYVRMMADSEYFSDVSVDIAESFKQNGLSPAFVDGLIENYVIPLDRSRLANIPIEFVHVALEKALTFKRNDEYLSFAADIMFEFDSFSQVFWDHIKDYPELLEPYFSTRRNEKAPRLNRELAKKFLPVEGNEALMYLLTRSAVEPFDFEVFKGFNLTLEQLAETLSQFSVCMTGCLVDKEINHLLWGYHDAKVKEQRAEEDTEYRVEEVSDDDETMNA